MNRPNPCASYRQTAIQTATPGQLTLQLFDGAVSFLERALQCFEQPDLVESYEAIHNHVTRARAIVEELNLALDMERGGEFASNMRRLYNYCDTLLEESNLRKSPAGVRDVLWRLRTLRDAWGTMLQQQCTAEAEQPRALCAAG